MTNDYRVDFDKNFRIDVDKNIAIKVTTPEGVQTTHFSSNFKALRFAVSELFRLYRIQKAAA